MDGLDDLVHDDRADTDRPSMATEEQEEDVGRGALDAPNCPRCGSTDTVTDADGEPVEFRGPAWDSDPFDDGGGE